MARPLHAPRLSLGRALRPALAGAIAAALAGGSASALAADATESGGLQEIVVTATRHEESLSKVPLSVTALTQENLDVRGVKDFQDVARFTPGVSIDNSGTNNISIRGISSSGGAGTTGIYIDDTPIQMRALAFNPDEALPKSFDIDRVEVLRGPQGTLFGAGSEGGTVRYITTQPSLTKTSVYSRGEVDFTQGGDPSYEIGVAGGTPVIDGTLGVRASVWYRKDGGWIDRVDPTAANPPASVVDKRANWDETVMMRLAAIWAPSERWSLTPSILFQDRYRNDVENYWPLYSDPSSHHFVSGNPTQRSAPDRFYLPALKIEGDFGSAKLISNTSYYHRINTTGYDGTLYNLGFYQSLLGLSGSSLVLDGNGIHLPAQIADYRAPASVRNTQQNITQEIRLQSADPNAKLIWTTGLFFTENRQSYLEQIYDPKVESFLNYFDTTVADFFSYCPVPTAADGSCSQPLTPGSLLANGDSYILSTRAKDTQYAWFGEGTYNFTDQWKATAGVRLSRMKYDFDTYTAGAQLYADPQYGHGDKSENSFTPKVGVQFQMDPNNLFYATYAKGFRPGGGNNPIPMAACAQDAVNMGLQNGFPKTFDSDTVQSYEVGAKNNFDNRLKLASSIYYIKWNNIQQTVIPPICQISFITNLGQAEAKGADVQADMALGRWVTAEVALGYTDARYTKDSRISPDPTILPLVLKGDGVVGQSGQPNSTFTASVGLEVRYAIADHDGFVRADYQYNGRASWFGAAQDPATSQYDPANYTLDPTNFVTLRAGLNFGGLQLQAFVDNLTDSHTVTNYNWSIDPGTGDSRLQRQFTFRPRTFGVGFTYRH
ncbi:MAG: TonB-dependent receptor [Proteobacteria bacterium]|nr:TonB-dependent receptor [Pseudomonadota bacterium]